MQNLWVLIGMFLSDCLLAITNTGKASFRGNHPLQS